jgi:hypothetical protein
MANAAAAWIGQDGNLWYKSSQGTQNWGAADNYEFVEGGIRAKNFNTPLGEGSGFAPGVDIIQDPLAPAKQPAQNGNGGGSAGTAQDKLDEQAYWQDQLTAADQQLGRLPGQLQTGERNIDSSYQSAYDRLLGDKATTERDYNTKKTQTREDNITAKGNIDTSVRNRNTGLQRLLGSKGAGTSSAATILAPYAAAKEGNAQRGQVSQAFGRNQQALDTAWGDYGTDWQDSANDLGTQRETQKQTLRSGIATTEAGIQEQKANAAVQKAQAGGQNYTQARNARSPYLTRINELISQIDSLGTNPTLTAKAPTYKAPELSSYDYNRGAAPTVGSGVDPGMAQGAGAYWTLLQGNKKKEQLA